VAETGAVYWPEGQPAHEFAVHAAAVKNPDGHGMHIAADAAEYVPAGHALHVDASVAPEKGDEEPAGQTLHDVAPELVLYCPDGQMLQ